MTDTIKYSEADGIGRLTLNIPARHNSLGREELESIRSYLANVQSSDTIRVLIVTGAGEKTFCAGASLAELSAGVIADDSFQQMTAQLADLAVPTVCALNGNVFGGGVELAASCDFRLGVEGMRMRVPAASLGLCYPLAGIQRFVECLGVRVTRRILVASEEFDTKRMLDIGFLDQIVARTELDDVVTRFVGHIAGLAPLSVQPMNVILRQIGRGALDEAQAEAMVARSFASADLQEGLAAQREKRQPVFRGR